MALASVNDKMGKEGRGEATDIRDDAVLRL